MSVVRQRQRLAGRIVKTCAENLQHGNKKKQDEKSDRERGDGQRKRIQAKELLHEPLAQTTALAGS